MSVPMNSPPRAPPVQYATPLGTRWQKEKAAAGSGAFEYPEDAKYVGPWIIGECVGKGASGRVRIARHRRTGQLAAVKILPLNPLVSSRAPATAQAKSEKQRLGIDREIVTMKLMDHPNIMRLYDVYEGDKELYLILEYVEGGELFDFLVNRGRLPPLEALAYFKQIVYGLNYAHTFSIIHRDLKPENILIHSLNPPLIKIADWGMAAFAPPTLQLETSCGSPHYASPEIVNGFKYCGTATDIWSCGVILYALLTGRLPFDDKNVRILLTKVKIGKYDMPSFVDPLARDLLTKMLVVDVNKRITMAEVLAHPWLEGSTPGIICMPAPPISELAKPLPSALHIDRDLFESLCIIWGRHADIEGIRADLLSPGHGLLAKAFYFLLQKHRGKSMEEHGILMDIDEILSADGKIVTKQYAAPRTKPVLQLHDLNRSSMQSPSGAPVQETAHVVAPPSGQYLRSDRPAPLPPSRTPSPLPVNVFTTPMERTPSRPHPPSPVGPRPPRPRQNTYSHRQSQGPPTPPSFVPNPDGARAREFSVHPAPPMATRSLTTGIHPHLTSGVHPRLPPMQRGAGSLPLPVRTSVHASGVPTSRPPSLYRPNTASNPGVIHAPVPVAIAPQPPMPSTPTPARAPQTECQPPLLEQDITMVNVQRAPWDVVRPSEIPRRIQPLGLRLQPARQQSEPVPFKEPSGGDKENAGAIPPISRPAHGDPGCHSGGLGFGHSVPMAKEMGNMMFLQESANGNQWKKDKRQRPAPLDLNGAAQGLQKRATFSLTSPMAGSPPALGSPVVGEFKGWFSNLFHWKAQTYLLYSVLDLATTRAETARVLEQFGVAVALEENQGWSVLRCRLDDGCDAYQAMKAVRFRVEFHVVGGPYTPGMSRSRGDLLMSTAAGYETVLGFVLEKGALSTFKMVYHRLRGEWRMDALTSPPAYPQTVGMATPSIEQQFMSMV